METINRKASYSTNTVPRNQVPTVFMVCSGLGNINRGFESFKRECFEVLKSESSIDLTLFKGGGTSSLNNELTLWNLPRDKWTTIQISRVIGKLTGIKGSYNTEQLSFFLSLIPYLHSREPDIIYFSDEQLGIFLWHWRRLTKQSYKLLFRNGGPAYPADKLLRWDHVQQLAPKYLQEALNAGVLAEKQSLIPNAIQMPSQQTFLTSVEREALRNQLGLPKKLPLLISVGVINKSHKRMDYVIRELAQLPKPRPSLLILGQQDPESPQVIQLGNTVLGGDNFQTRTVPHSAIANYYKAADAFVLASFSEGLPRVLVEALSHGLPCMAHDYEITRFVLGKEGYLADFNQPGNLTNLIPQALATTNDFSKRQLRYQRAYEHFSWEKLRPKYINMIQDCANA